MNNSRTSWDVLLAQPALDLRPNGAYACFTSLRREDYVAKRQAGKVRVDGSYVQFLRNKGPLVDNVRQFPDAFAAEA